MHHCSVTTPASIAILITSDGEDAATSPLTNNLLRRRDGNRQSIGGNEVLIVLLLLLLHHLVKAEKNEQPSVTDATVLDLL